MSNVAHTRTLTPGVSYVPGRLILIGWTSGDGSAHLGYLAWDYFDQTGRYLGPDAHGIEPIFAIEEL